MADAAIRELTDMLGPGNVLASNADKISYSYDGTYISHRPDVVVFPRDTEDVQHVLAVARRYRMPVFTRGSGTGLSGGSIPLGGIALVMTRMNRILELSHADMLVRVQPGVLTAELQAAVQTRGLFYPPDPGSARISTIGGNIVQNAGGPRSFQYGTTGRFVLGLEVVLADGTVLNTGGRTSKNVTGYDLTSLFVGSEGTLGIVTEATLSLLPPPPPGRGTLVASFDDTHTLGRAIGALAAHPARPTSVEFLDGHCLAVLAAHRPPDFPAGAADTAGVARTAGAGAAAGVLLCEVLEWPESLERRLSELADVCREQGAITATELVDADAQRQIWSMREALSPATARLKPTKISEDTTVPIGAIADFLTDLEHIRQRLLVDLIVFGHAGDGNFHPNLICDERDEDEMRRVQEAIDDIFASALRHRGTLSGEHGIGLVKRPYMAQAIPEATLGTMRQMKRLLDPDNLLNPGKMFPDSRDDENENGNENKAEDEDEVKEVRRA